VEDVVSVLSFIDNKENWGVYLQGGVRYLPERDFEAITERVLPITSSSSSAVGDKFVVSPTEFALETHLEEFIDKNWSHIDFGRSLQRYVTDEENGRQFPAGQWSIDFLCKDTATGNLVVIELKKGQTSDATVGQILRYMAWVGRKYRRDWPTSGRHHHRAGCRRCPSVCVEEGSGYQRAYLPREFRTTKSQLRPNVSSGLLRNGFTTTTRSKSCPACKSSVSRYWQEAAFAADTISESQKEIL
jgi:hypothetical protein